MKLVYISGPMSGIADFNYPAFSAAAADLRDLGYNVISPHEIHPDLDQEWQHYMRRDIRYLTDCTAVFALKGWRQSRGARIEIAIAHALDIPVFDYESDSHKQFDDADLPQITYPPRPSRHDVYG